MKNKIQTSGRWPRRLAAAAVAVIVLAAIALAAGVWGIDYLVDIWWFNSLGYDAYYWQRLLYRYAVFGSTTLLFFLVFFLNFWIAARFLRTGPTTPDETVRDPSRRRRLFKQFQAGSIWFYGPLSLILSIPIAMPLFRHWERFLFFIFGRYTGTVDPYFGKDISFYLFSYPVYNLVQHRLLLALLILAIGLLILYAVKNRLMQRRLLAFRRGARRHLSLLTLVLFGMGVWGFMLQRYGLVYDASHEPLFHGPGYVQMRVVLPLIWACMITLAAAAVSLTIVIQRGKGIKTCLVLWLTFILAATLRTTDVLPHLVQTYVVKPNEIDKESPYIAGHIQATLDAYDLADTQVREFNHERFPSSGDLPVVDEVLRNIPVWEGNSLVDVFQQLQELRSYYTFPLVSVGRYWIEGRQQQVFLSPREIEFDNLPGQARNWINEHLTYTHGYGAVMTPASQDGGTPMTWFMHGIPPQSDHGIFTEQSRIYYGLETYNYSIAPNGAGELDYPKGNDNVMTYYAGQGGVPISSLFRKFLLAYYLKNKDVFFSTKITEQSKLLIRRNILERIRYLVPYLQFDQQPYVAVTPSGIYWIVDAYTTSANYPAAAPMNIGGPTFNYVRNAVKIVVDAYHGSIDIYMYDRSDPIIDAYDRIYPGLFHDKQNLPTALRQHVRYPKDFFDVQMQVYAKYHQEDTQVFYQQEDLWTFAEGVGKDNTVPLRPYYVTLDLIDSGQLDFLLLLPMFPKNRDNLRAVAIAGCDPDNYGRLIVYNFPKGELVHGPAQIDALINQDPDISQQFTLWDQAGSKVERGKMIILPMGNSVLFIQPVYLEATTRVKIPELQGIIMSEGEVVVMETTVKGAYDELKRRIQQEFQPKPELIESQPKAVESRNTTGPDSGDATEAEKTDSAQEQRAPSAPQPDPEPVRPTPGTGAQ